MKIDQHTKESMLNKKIKLPIWINFSSGTGKNNPIIDDL